MALPFNGQREVVLRCLLNTARLAAGPGEAAWGLRLFW
jgi:hypothetical protein